MFYVGLDIHTKRIAFCVLSDKGQLVQRGQVRGLDEVLRILKGLPDRFEVCYEASCGYGHYHDLLKRLAKLLYLGEAPAVHVPALDVRAWRELINCRGQVIAKRTRAKNALRALLRGAGVSCPRPRSSCGGTCCSRRSRRSTASGGASSTSWVAGRNKRPPSPGCAA